MTISRIPSIEGGIQPTLLTAKGDLISATAASTPQRLAVGSDAQILVADSSTATGLKWATPAAGGKVLQVVMGTTSTLVTNATTTYADTTLSATITPSATSSKILVLVMQNGVFKNSTNADNGTFLQLLRGSTSIIVFETELGWTQTALKLSLASGTNYLDSPATTSATTYKTQFKSIIAATSASIVQANGENSTMILMEIGA